MAGAQIYDFRFLLENLKFLIYLIIFLISISRHSLNRNKGKIFWKHNISWQICLFTKIDFNKDGMYLNGDTWLQVSIAMLSSLPNSAVPQMVVLVVEEKPGHLHPHLKKLASSSGWGYLKWTVQKFPTMTLSYKYTK